MKNQGQQVNAAPLGVGVGIGVGVAGFQHSQLLPPAGGVASPAALESGVPHRVVSLLRVLPPETCAPRLSLSESLNLFRGREARFLVLERLESDNLRKDELLWPGV